MKNQKLLLKKMSGVSLMLLLFLFISNCASGDKIFSTDVWNITYDDQQGGIALTYKSKNICNGMYASYGKGRRSRQVTMPAIKSVRAKFPILSGKDIYIRWSIRIRSFRS